MKIFTFAFIACLAWVGVAQADIDIGVSIGEKPATWSTEKMKALKGYWWGNPTFGGVTYKQFWLTAPMGASLCCSVDADKEGAIAIIEVHPTVDHTTAEAWVKEYGPKIQAQFKDNKDVVVAMHLAQDYPCVVILKKPLLDAYSATCEAKVVK